jgi:hypothetical protein
MDSIASIASSGDVRGLPCPGMISAIRPSIAIARSTASDCRCAATSPSGAEITVEEPSPSSVSPESNRPPCTSTPTLSTVCPGRWMMWATTPWSPSKAVGTA